jgi:epoxyqueuosine reductase QueG
MSNARPPIDHDLKTALVDRLKQVGAYAVGVADPYQGYEHALPGRHPLALWPECQSVVVFAVACSPEMNNTYLGPYAPWTGPRDVGPVPDDLASETHALDRLVRILIASVTLKGVAVVQGRGHQVRFTTGPGDFGIPLLPQLKLSAYEAGLGVYGRAGVILNPELGNRLRLGGLMTDARLPADGRLTDYAPCEDCDLCVRICPAQAFDLDPQATYPSSWSRETCMARRAEIAARGFYCHNCFSVCPAGAVEDDDLLLTRQAVNVFRGERHPRGA